MLLSKMLYYNLLLLHFQRYVQKPLCSFLLGVFNFRWSVTSDNSYLNWRIHLFLPITNSRKKMKCWIFLGLFASRINKENTNFMRSKELPYSPTRLVKTRILESEFVSFRLEIYNWIPFSRNNFTILRSNVF